jgi:hypothetical protein
MFDTPTSVRPTVIGLLEDVAEPTETPYEPTAALNERSSDDTDLCPADRDQLPAAAALLDAAYKEMANVP